MLDSSYKGVKRLFVLAYNNAAGDDQVPVEVSEKYFLPRVKITTSKVMEEIFLIKPINDSIKQYDEVRKVAIGQGDD